MGLERFFYHGDKFGIQAKYADCLRLIVGRLNASASAKDMDFPGLHLHELGGNGDVYGQSS
ncbi:MAG TPA: type II toxin-antitoxin system RelE/ParE family toxin [Gammaproteobacteria bacterium]|nr:type II toxin-antitoxin system RelE/ParE family toxin [Gammaproteobacteria bacterium]